ncbi:MAG: carbon-nitrogen hydrolase family protein [Caldilineales bacterium]|nr:carbon-nitrogen hydrolase family protein [Caldilineales bacterium]
MTRPQPSDETLTIGLAQIAPVWLDRAATLAKVLQRMAEAAAQGCQLLAFGEAIVPGYPFWVERTDGARFNHPTQKEIYAHYMDQAVRIERGHLDEVRALAARSEMAVVLGCIERAADRGGHSLYCSLVYIDNQGQIANVHRKLVPTHEERLVWSPGDGYGLRVFPLGPFTMGGLNCWENWMPLPRAALYGQGEDLHVAIWPGNLRNTQDITRFIAVEARSYVLSVSGLMRLSDFPPATPHLDQILADGGEPPSDLGAFLANGGSCLAGPDGQWVIEPQVGMETVVVAAIDHRRVREERQMLDPAGHYSRPDVTQLTVNRRRQSTVLFEQ